MAAGNRPAVSQTQRPFPRAGNARLLQPFGDRFSPAIAASVLFTQKFN